jgi:hypothetical protein
LKINKWLFKVLVKIVFVLFLRESDTSVTKLVLGLMAV